MYHLTCHSSSDVLRQSWGRLHRAGGRWVRHVATTWKRPDTQSLGTTDFFIDVTRWSRLLWPATSTTVTCTHTTQPRYTEPLYHRLLHRRHMLVATPLTCNMHSSDMYTHDTATQRIKPLLHSNSCVETATHSIKQSASDWLFAESTLSRRRWMRRTFLLA